MNILFCFRERIITINDASKPWSKLWQDISAYFRETTVHGFRYIVEGENIIEKLFWVMIIIAGFLVSGYFILSSFHDWANTPIETTIDSLTMPIEELYQPAITVCNPDGLQMPLRNRWMYLEHLLNWIDTDKSKSLI